MPHTPPFGGHAKWLLSATAAGLIALLPFASGKAGDAGGIAPQIPRDQWKDCGFNDQIIGCIDKQLSNGLSLVWKDGLRMTYLEQQGRQVGEVVYLVDRLGGLWRREVLAQGNTLLTSLGSGNRIVVPLRFPCRPPLKGEVGYCRY
jgi:hypothetical protein